VESLLSDPVGGLAANLGERAGVGVTLERPTDAAHGDYATNVALRLAGERRRPPREIAEELRAAFETAPEVERAEVAGPGFVNVFLTDAWFGDALGAMLAAGRAFGGGFADTGERVQVEMVSANPTGPLTVASARNGAYGDSVARLLEFAGHTVEREYYYNDAGVQMDRFRASVEARRHGEEPPEDGYRGAYVTDLAKLDGDPVTQMLESIEHSLERFRIQFDSFARQSELEARLGEYLPRLDTYEKDGALWARSSAYGDDDDWVLVRSQEQGGLPTYRGADVVYLADKLDRGFDRAIYVLGADHHGTRKWYAAIARMLGYDPERVEVLLYQLVHLTRGGEATRMAKRRGDVVFLDDFMDEVGVDFSRWFLVDRGHDQTIEIDVDLAAEKSKKNPVYYVQYVHARTCGIFREAGADAVVDPEPLMPLHAEERDLVKRLAEFPEVVREAVERRGPHALPVYAIRVADDFHRFYHEHRVVAAKGGDHETFRLALMKVTQNVIARSLDLIGVDAPERM